MKYEITNDNIDPFYAEVKGTLQGDFETDYYYNRNAFLKLLEAFAKKRLPNKNYYLYIGHDQTV